MANIFICNVDYNINIDKSLFNNMLANKKGTALISSFNAYSKLKEILLTHYNINMDDLHILKTPYGKPYFNKLNLFFNISHSKDYFVIGISDSEIGVDIQLINDSTNQNLANKMNIANLDNLTYYKKFSSLEAHYKKIGTGLYPSQLNENINITYQSILSNNIDKYVLSIDCDEDIKIYNCSNLK